GAELLRLLAGRARGAIDLLRGVLLAAADPDRCDRDPGDPRGPPDRSKRTPHRTLLALLGLETRRRVYPIPSPRMIHRDQRDRLPGARARQPSTRTGRLAWKASSASTAWA